MEGGLFLEREKLRLSVLIERLSNVPKNSNIENEIIMEIHELVQYAQRILTRLDDTSKDIVNEYLVLEQKAKYVTILFDILVPKHRPIDIQTSDAGPG